MKWTPEREADLKGMWQRVPVSKIARQLQTSAGSIYRQARKLGLKTRKRTPHPLSRTHHAVTSAQPRHRRFLVDAETSPGLLVSGKESRKIGRVVTKGAWAGLPIYTLTLAERITCPRSCVMWEGCYGNNMNWARRHILDRALIERLRWELTALAARHPGGFVVHPHILGDFGSDQDPALAIDYVNAWSGWLARFPHMRIWGYTAHNPHGDIGGAIRRLNSDYPNRCRIRFSGSDAGAFGALVIDKAEDSQRLLCPFEAERVKDCGACALCWSANLTIEFLRH